MPELTPHVSKQVQSIQRKTKTFYQGRASLCDGGDKIKTEGSCCGDHWRLLCACVHLSTFIHAHRYDFFLYAHTPYDAFRIIFLYAHEDVYSYQRRQKWTPLAFQHARTPTLNLFTYSHVRVLVCLRTRLSALVSVHMYASLSLLFARFRVFVCAYSNNNRSSSAKIQSCTRPRCIHSTYYQQTAVYTSMKCTHLYLCGSWNCNSMPERVILNNTCWIPRTSVSGTCLPALKYVSCIFLFTLYLISLCIRIITFS